MVSTETVLAPTWRAETLNKGHGWITLFLKVSYLLRGGNNAPSKLTELSIDTGSVKTLGQVSDINFSSHLQVLEKVLRFSKKTTAVKLKCANLTYIRFKAISRCWITLNIYWLLLPFPISGGESFIVAGPDQNIRGQRGGQRGPGQPGQGRAGGRHLRRQEAGVEVGAGQREARARRVDRVPARAADHETRGYRKEM